MRTDPWTPEELTILKAKAALFYRVKDIVPFLPGRTYDAINTRMSLMGIKARTYTDDIEIGQKYGRLTAIEKRSFPRNETSIICQCDCGKMTKVKANTLMTGKTLSCGCLRLETRKRLRTAPGESGAKTFVFQIRYRAKKKGHDVTLTDQELIDMSQKECKYCEIEPYQKCKAKRGSNGAAVNSTFIYNGIDRVDSKKGYIHGNCVPCCGVCNTSKLNRTLEDWHAHTKRLFFVAVKKGFYGSIPALIKELAVLMAPKLVLVEN